jgi:hypothetical protein
VEVSRLQQQHAGKARRFNVHSAISIAQFPMAQFPWRGAAWSFRQSPTEEPMGAPFMTSKGARVKPASKGRTGAPEEIRTPAPRFVVWFRRFSTALTCTLPYSRLRNKPLINK